MMKRSPTDTTLDVRQLMLFTEIYAARSVTRAAERLDLSQPTVSIWLGKLRRRLNDPLFVRTSSGMQPTPRADALIGPARQALEMVHSLSAATPAFAPATARRNFRILMTDASHITLLPTILAHVRAVAPGVRLEVGPIAADTARALEVGDADLAVGFIPGLESAFHHRTLYEQDFVCLVSARHPRIGKVFTSRAYQQEAHIGILSGTVYTIVDAALKSQRCERRVLLELPGFLGLAAIVSTTDLVATVPRTIGETLAQSANLRVCPCPIEIPPFPVELHWHERYHHEAGNRWLRGVCVDLLETRSTRRRSPKLPMR
jgi:DNA-binding transcriptional LysR family regulator